MGQRGALVNVADEFEDVLAFEVTMASDAVSSHEFIRVTAQNLPYLVGCPDKEFAFLTLAAIVPRAKAEWASASCVLQNPPAGSVISRMT
jgi:hypothetical protein